MRRAAFRIERASYAFFFSLSAKRNKREAAFFIPMPAYGNVNQSIKRLPYAAETAADIPFRPVAGSASGHFFRSS